MRCKKLLGLGLLLTLPCDISPDKAVAATATTTFQVIANVQVTCAIRATELNFGDYTGLSLSAQSEITVNCTNTAQWNVGLNAGTASGATVTTRRMTGPAAFLLSYSLSSDAAHTVNWGQYRRHRHRVGHRDRR
jgi:spore coat protein U-like protein